MVRLDKFYDDYWSKKPDKADQSRLQLILEHVPKSGSVLIFNSGPGMLAEQLRTRDGERSMLLTEVSYVGSRRAREKGFNVIQYAGNGAIPFKDAAFDIVISDSAVEHFMDHEQLIRELVRVLKPGGRLVMLAPNIAHWRHRLWLLFGSFPQVQDGPTDFSHLRFQTLKDTRRLFRQLGLKECGASGSASIWVTGLYPAWLKWALRKLRLRGVYELLARHFPAVFARDFIVAAVKL